MFFVLCIFVCASAATTGQVMTGQPHDVPVNSSKVVAAARFALAEFNRANAENQPAYELVNITSAKIQVVAGINYILEVELEPVVCKKSETDGSKTCDFAFKVLQCNFVVTEIPWEDSRILTTKKCHQHNA